MEFFSNFILTNWTLVFLVLLSGGMLLMPSFLNAGGNNGVSSQEAVTMMNRQKASVVDVRDAADFAKGAIKGSVNVPLSDVKDKLEAAVKDKTRPVLFVCTQGIRSRGAANAAKKLGYAEAKSLTGGLKAWAEANMPLTVASKTA